MELDRVSEIVWGQCLKARRGERALIVADKSREGIARSLERVGKKFCDCSLILIKETPRPGAEPEPWAAERMLGNDIIICPTKNSLTHTEAVTGAKKSGARAITLPGITEDIYMRCVDVDYRAMEKETKRVANLIAGRELTITTKAGTDIFIPLGNREICECFGISMKGKVVNIPDGEACVAPLEGKSEGKIVVDARKNPFTITVAKGEMADCTSRDVWKLHDVENGRNLAELGIGTNPKATITGNVLED
jgi:leucyl aminopeptidase (aminopeptidase T)